MNGDFLATLHLTPPQIAAEQEAWGDVATAIHCTSEAEAQERLAVYRNNVVSSLSQALADIFPVCRQLVGEEFFAALSLEFIQQNLPSSPILSEYGAQFGKFITTFPPLASLPYLSEVAELEYALLSQTLKAEQAVLSTNEIQQQLAAMENPEQSYWSLADNITLWHSHYATGSLYLAHQPDSPLSLSDIHWQQGEYLLLAKQGLWGHCYQLDIPTFQLLRRLQAGDSLENACQAIEPQQLSSTFSQMVSLPIICSINSLASSAQGKS